MSDGYIRKNRCPQCGEPHWFRSWVGQFCHKSNDGLCVSDFDLMFHRFKQSKDKRGSRDTEHLMVVEVKTGTEKLGVAQRDTLSVFNGTLSTLIPVDGSKIGVESRPGMVRNGKKKIVWHGVHLLRVPKIESKVGPFFFDNRPIAPSTLAGVLNFDLDSRHPHKPLDIDRRHKAPPPSQLFDHLYNLS